MPLTRHDHGIVAMIRHTCTEYSPIHMDVIGTANKEVPYTLCIEKSRTRHLSAASGFRYTTVSRALSNVALKAFEQDFSCPNLAWATVISWAAWAGWRWATSACSQNSLHRASYGKDESSVSQVKSCSIRDLFADSCQLGVEMFHDFVWIVALQTYRSFQDSNRQAMQV